MNVYVDSVFNIHGLTYREMEVVAIALSLHKFSGADDQEVANSLVRTLPKEFQGWSKYK